MRKRDYFAMIIPSCSHSSVVKVRCKWTGGSTVEVNIEIEKFTVACVHIVVKTLKFEKFTLPFCRPRQRTIYLLFCQNTNVSNYILDEVFVMSRIIKVEVRVISRKFILLGPPQF